MFRIVFQIELKFEKKKCFCGGGGGGGGGAKISVTAGKSLEAKKRTSIRLRNT